ncbi:hypothetical protein GCK32_014994, partial [Trichostrongylus colubriformis]
MATIGACKANLTKAHTSLEAARGKVPQELLNPFNNESVSLDEERQLLEHRQDSLRTHLTNMRAVLRVMKERQQAFLAYVGNSGNKEADNDAYVEYMQESRVEESIVTAERLIHVLHANLEEACARSEHLRSRPADHPQEHRQARDVGQQEETHMRVHTNSRTQSPRSQTPLRDTPLRDAVEANSATYASQQTSSQPSVQLGKLTLEPFTGDITQFHRFWRAFEIAVHDDHSISTTFKFLYLQGLLKGDAQIVLQDLDPDECNYYELVRALKKRYDRPHKTRAVLRKQLQQLPTASNTGTDLRNTWFRISGILRGLRKFEDFRTVLPILDLSGADFDLHQIMHHLDNIIASREKYEETTTLKDGYSVNNTSSNQRTSPVRDTQSGWRAGSPHPNAFQHQAQDSDSELQQLNHCYQSRSAQREVAKAALMLVKANAYTYNTSYVEEVVLLLDPGAQNSFITTSTAHRLRLPIYDKKERTFLTFGGHETTEVTGVVDVDLLDSSDRILRVHLTSKDIITSTQVPPRLSDADFKFLRDNRLPIPSCTSSRPVLPDILIGIDNYWTFSYRNPQLLALGYGTDIYKVRHRRIGQFGFSVGIPKRPDTDEVHTSSKADDEIARRL